MYSKNTPGTLRRAIRRRSSMHMAFLSAFAKPRLAFIAVWIARSAHE